MCEAKQLATLIHDVLRHRRFLFYVLPFQSYLTQMTYSNTTFAGTDSGCVILGLDFKDIGVGLT